MTLETQIRTDLTEAMKAQDSTRRAVLRSAIAAIQAAGKTKAGEKTLSDRDVIAILRTQISQREEAAENFTKVKATDRAAQELDEASILESYLPKQLNDEQLNAIVAKVLGNGVYTQRDFGKLMGQLKAAVGDQADGGRVAAALKSRIA